MSYCTACTLCHWCGKKEAGNGLTQQEEERKTKEKIHGCTERKHESGGCDRECHRRLSVLQKDEPLRFLRTPLKTWLHHKTPFIPNLACFTLILLPCFSLKQYSNVLPFHVFLYPMNISKHQEVTMLLPGIWTPYCPIDHYISTCFGDKDVGSINNNIGFKQDADNDNDQKRNNYVIIKSITKEKSFIVHINMPFQISNIPSFEYLHVCYRSCHQDHFCLFECQEDPHCNQTAECCWEQVHWLHSIAFQPFLNLQSTAACGKSKTKVYKSTDRMPKPLTCILTAFSKHVSHHNMLQWFPLAFWKNIVAQNSLFSPLILLIPCNTVLQLALQLWAEALLIFFQNYTSKSRQQSLTG